MTTTNADQTRRWIAARDRAIKENVAICYFEQIDRWIATSGTQTGTAYVITVDGNVAVECSCAAGQAGDPVCKHRAAFYDRIGAIPCSIDALEAEDLARDAAATRAPRACCWCSGRGKSFNDHYMEVRPCSWCEGTGSGTPVVA